jgi:molecular chaperone GrpE
MRRALEALPAEAAAAAEGPLKALIDGIELTERDLLKTLERHGIRKLEPKGEKFDPNLHQAMFEVPDPTVPNGTVREVVQAGFVIGDRVLRPALVGVAKGGAKPAPATPSDAGQTVDKQA